ncbi:MAG: DNA translocase FtsK 4TM domain-containing protein [Legionella sp.]|nr:DNA translocase FtsK 4TM domain-containing protein [Legionella sp.]
MAKRQTRKKTKDVHTNAAALPYFLVRRLREGGFIFLLAFALFLFLALARYNVDAPVLSPHSAQKAVIYSTGQVGVYISSFLYFLFGYLSFLLPLGCVYLAWFVLKAAPTPKPVNLIQTAHLPTVLLKAGGFGLMLLGSTALLQLISSPGELNAATAYILSAAHPRGGIIGYFIAQNVKSALSLSGACLLLAAATLVGTTLFTGLSWIKVTEMLGRCTLFLAQSLFRLLRLSLFKTFNGLRYVVYKGFGLLSLFSRVSHLTTAFIKQGIGQSLSRILGLPKKFFSVLRNRRRLKKEATALKTVDSLKRQKSKLTPKKREVESSSTVEKPPTAISMSPTAVQIPAEATAPSPSPEVKKKIRNKDTSGLLPSLSLLDKGEPNKIKGGYTYQDLEKLSREVEQHLLDFGIQADVVAVHPGPVITRFELQLAAGIKVSKLSALAKDLARSLSVISVRVVEVIPGKTVVGLELPNQQRDMVRLSEVLSADVYQQASSPLILALGVDIAGHPMVVDLAKMPHLLVAGTTGSGKSVGINAMILSLLFRLTPEQVRLIMVDPKMLELSIYDRIPHLLTPVVTDMKEAASALRWCVEEMERRYRLMAAFGVRNLLGFNLKVKDAIAKGEPLVDPCWKSLHTLEESPPTLEPLPHIVVIIDELADMMMVVGKKVEQLIARIAQKARAAGIHLILATQRPSVDVLTGLIKSNIPTRVSFQVSSKIDSRTILDQQGAEQLLGHGDMLYLTPGSGAPLRIHGAFVDDKEVHRVTDAWRERGEPDYLVEITQSFDGADGVEGENQDLDESDPLYDQAVAFVVQTRKASISSVQRRLKVGYNRAARLVETMESKGIVGPLSGGTRDVLVPEFSED